MPRSTSVNHQVGFAPPEMPRVPVIVPPGLAWDLVRTYVHNPYALALLPVAHMSPSGEALPLAATMPPVDFRDWCIEHGGGISEVDTSFESSTDPTATHLDPTATHHDPTDCQPTTRRVVLAPPAILEFTRQRPPVTKKFVQVRFKTSFHVYFTRLPVLAGDFVVVPMDGGFHCGFVERCFKRLPRGPLHSEDFEGKRTFIAPTVLRVATEKDLETLAKHREKEEHLRKRITELAELHAVEMEVESVEVQLDDKKLTVRFRATKDVFFVPVVEALYREVHCRIWMHRINRHSAGYTPLPAKASNWKSHKGRMASKRAAQPSTRETQKEA